MLIDHCYLCIYMPRNVFHLGLIYIILTFLITSYVSYSPVLNRRSAASAVTSTFSLRGEASDYCLRRHGAAGESN